MAMLVIGVVVVVMPSGVEHRGEAAEITRRILVVVVVMPSGVEHLLGGTPEAFTSCRRRRDAIRR